MQLEDFLKFEKEHDLLRYKFSNGGYCMWPYIRYNVAAELLSFDEDKASVSDNSIMFAKLKKMAIVFYNFFKSFDPRKNAGRIKRSQLLFITNDVSDVQSKEGWYNRTLDGFAECKSDCSMILIFSDSTRHTPRRYKNYYIDVRNRLYCSILAKMRHISMVDKYTVDMLIREVEDNFPDVKLQLNNRIKNLLYNKCKTIDFEIKYLKRLIERIAPKEAIVEDGCYGYDKAYYIKVLKQCGVKVLEPQHGLIGLNHIAYNYDYPENAEYMEYLPDIYMSYGEYWKSVSRLPMNVVPIGGVNFYRNAVNEIEKKGQVLIALTEHSNYWVDFVKEYLEDVEKADIVIKAHPRFAHLLSDFNELEGVKGVALCSAGNIYKFISEAEFILSDKSTVIFEAYCMNKKVFVYDCELSNNYIPNDIGYRFRTYSEYKNIVNNLGENCEIHNDAEYYFGKEWENNFKNLINQIDFEREKRT